MRYRSAGILSARQDVRTPCSRICRVQEPIAFTKTLNWLPGFKLTVKPPENKVAIAVLPLQ
ncbi:MAG: hypothetical protein KME15_18505 [Drouetiella hepatica Uher 2000/2452]|uniref:Uncharacterized protein n=1 Tax=Drouetiella hepatica Uher 2000/2452 TaxID=904376 RepID=A0A951QEX0_9CYAN|nr:hypothetical protein [Drouetiella hepatica Uher 2000/2452]